MANGLNKVEIIGRLGREPEMRFVGEKAVTNISVATGGKYTRRNGEEGDDTEWHRVEMWDKLAEIANQYLVKGSQVYIEGRLKTDKYTDKDGNEKYSTKIVAREMLMLGSRNDNAPQEADEAPRKAAPQQQDGARAIPTRRAIPANRPPRYQPVAADESGDDADLPF